MPLVDAVATHDTESGRTAVFLVNRSLDEEVTIDISDLQDLTIEEALTLADDDIYAANTLTDPEPGGCGDELLGPDRGRSAHRRAARRLVDRCRPHRRRSDRSGERPAHQQFRPATAGCTHWTAHSSAQPGPVRLTDTSHSAFRPSTRGLITGGLWAERRRVNREVSVPEAWDRLHEAGNFHNLELAAGLIIGDVRQRPPVPGQRRLQVAGGDRLDAGRPGAVRRRAWAVAGVSRCVIHLC